MISNEEILKNAPDDATHYKRGGYHKITFDFRYIPDIKRIAELEQVLIKLNTLGGLGLDRHQWINDALKGAKF